MQTLASKTSLLLVSALCALIGIAWLAGSSVLLESYIVIEHRKAVYLGKQIETLFSFTFNDMHEKSGYWSNWDAPHAFLHHPGPSFIDANGGIKVLNGNQIDVMLLFNLQHVPVDGIARTADGEHATRELPPDLVQLLAPGAPLWHQLAHSPLGFAGIINLRQGPLFISVRPVLDNVGNGPASGFMLWGRYVDGRLFASLPNLFPYPLTLVPVGPAPLPEDAQSVLDAFMPTQSVAVRLLGEQSIASYVVLRTIYDDPAAIVTLTAPRDISAQAEQTMVFFTQTLAAGGIALGFLIMWLLRYHVISRLSLLMQGIHRLRQQPMHPVFVGGNDELTSIADAINQLIADRADTDAALRHSEERFRMLHEKAADGMFFLTDDTILTANPAAAKLFGFDDPLLLAGKRFMTLMPPAQHGGVPSAEVFGRAYETALETGTHHGEWLFKHHGGRELPCEVLLTALPHGQRVVVHASLRDITARKRAEEEIARLAFHDSLTGLANRSLFHEHMKQAIHRKLRNPQHLYAVMFIDLDRFKIINDSLGHPVGDALLKAVAELLRTSVRSTDTVCRISGDEFAILLDGLASTRSGVQLARRIRQRLKQLHSIAGHDLSVSASFGLVFGTKEDLDPQHVLRNADIAMYHAKRAGKDRLRVFSARMSALAQSNMQLETDLRLAIAADTLHSHYQPIIHAASGKLEGFEALARWDHPELGAIAPAQFIPVAEDTGRILELGRQMLHRACAFGAQINARTGHHNIVIHVNLSPRQFLARHLTQEVAAALTANGLKPHQLVLEITESTLMDNPQMAIAAMQRLKDIGVRLALDDFGTGYSSLGRLQDYPMDTIKIDRSFVRSMHAKADVEPVLTAMLRLVRQLGLVAIVEGVETPRQANDLVLFGAPLMQGFLFSKPLAPEDALELVTAMKRGDHFTLRGTLVRAGQDGS